MPLRSISWEDFHALGPQEKAPHLGQAGHLFHVLVAQQFERGALESLGALATKIRFIAKQEAGMRFLRDQLPHKRAMLYFTQPSTRTFLSFYAACEILGLSIGEVRDRSMSSEYKGESPEDSVRAFSSYFDLLVMRSEIGGLAERMAWVLSNTDRPVPIVNAGSGKDQHPTQALLDIYTLQRSFEKRGGVDGKTVVFCGDLARGRTVRSLSCLLTKYDDVKQVFVAPEELQIGEDVSGMLDAAGVCYEVTPALAGQLPKADALYMTRIQDEWDEDKGESARIDTSGYSFRKEDLAVLKSDAIIMHPLPRRQEIDTAVDTDPRAMYWRQMRNGMWVRTALIATIFERDRVIRDYYAENH